MPVPSLAALVLAAGKGTRLDGGKLNLPWEGKTLASHVLALAEQTGLFTQLACVVGYEAEAVCRGFTEAGLNTSWKTASSEKASSRWHIIHNLEWEQGQSTSLCAGIRWITQQPEPADAVVVFLGDQPRVQPQTIKALAGVYTAKAGSNTMLAAAPTFHNKRGNPVLLRNHLFAQIMNITGDTGARALLNGLQDKLHLVPVDDPGILFDIDTPEAYALLQNTFHTQNR